MILFGQLDSPFLRRVAVTLHAYGLPFERRSLSVFRDFKAVMDINPLGKVPALVLDDGEALFDSQMILDHLDERVGPELALTPPAGADRRRVLRCATVALGVADKIVALNIEARIRADGTAARRMVGRFESQVTSALRWLEAEKPDPWFLGDAMTQADVTAACVLTHVHVRRPEMFRAEDYPALATLRERAEVLPGFKANPFMDG